MRPGGYMQKRGILKSSSKTWYTALVRDDTSTLIMTSEATSRGGLMGTRAVLVGLGKNMNRDSSSNTASANMIAACWGFGFEGEGSVERGVGFGLEG